MENANSQVPKGAASHGARHYIVVNGRRVGYCEGVDYSQQVNQLDLEVLDNILTEEHVIGGITYTGSIRIVKVVGRSLAAAGISVPLDQVFTRAPLTVQIVDRPTGTVMRTLRRVALTGKSYNVAKGTLTVEQVSFKFIDSTDETGLVDV